MPQGFTPNPRAGATIQTGMRDVAGTLSQRVIADVADEIIYYEPKSAPLTAILKHIKRTMKATQPQFHWIEKDPLPRSVQSSADYADPSATSIVLASGHGGRVGANYVLLNTRSRESMLVTVVSTDTLTVVRGLGTSTGTILTTDTIIITRAVFEEGSDVGSQKTTQERDNYNYCETIRRAFGFTGRQQNTDLYGGKDPDTERKAQGVEHMKDIEAALLFGNRDSFTGAGGKQQTFTGGLEFFITSNVYDVAGTEPTLRAFMEFMEVVMQEGEGGVQFGSGTKYFFCSNRWLTTFDGWKEQKLEMKPIDNTLDLEVAEIVTSHGKIILVPEPLLDKMGHPDWGFVLDLNHLVYRFYQGRDTKILEGRQGNGIDGYIEEYLTDFGLQIELEAAHGIVKGLPV